MGVCEGQDKNETPPLEAVCARLACPRMPFSGRAKDIVPEGYSPKQSGGTGAPPKERNGLSCRRVPALGAKDSPEPGLQT